MVSSKGRGESAEATHFAESKSRVIASAAALYSALAPQADLSSRATFSLLSSITLIGVSLAETKPQTVQLLGFTFQNQSWLVLAGTLALVVAYSVALLLLAWRVELRRRRYVAGPAALNLSIELNSLSETIPEKIRTKLDLVLADIERIQGDAKEFQSTYEAKLANLDSEEAELKERLQRNEADLALAYREGRISMQAMLQGFSDGYEEQKELREKRFRLRSEQVSRGVSIGRQLSELTEEHGRFHELRSAEMNYVKEMAREIVLAGELSLYMTRLGLTFPILVAVAGWATFAYNAFLG
ncbi:hypothetical protein [Arenimonas sp.]|uniref:hypothetical protein n=1 Tax=Arenimonas sp. TaxID=1872635 RepID=UPI0035B4D684